MAAAFTLLTADNTVVCLAGRRTLLIEIERMRAVGKSEQPAGAYS